MMAVKRVDWDVILQNSEMQKAAVDFSLGLLSRDNFYNYAVFFGVGGVAEDQSTGRGVYGMRVIGVEGRGVIYDFYATGPGTNYGSSSSIRWKNNIQIIDNALDMVQDLRGVYFDWDEEHGGQHDIGMIAEEVGQVLPEIVGYEENGIDASGMDYSKLTPLLVEAIKELKEQNDELQARIKALEAK